MGGAYLDVADIHDGGSRTRALVCVLSPHLRVVGGDLSDGDLKEFDYV